MFEFSKQLFSILLLCSLFTGCTNLVELPSSDKLQLLANDINLKDVPYFAQEDNQCGPAALTTLLVHRGVEVSVEQLNQQLYIPAKGGSLAIELKAQARQYEMLAYVLKPDIFDLLSELHAGNPVIVMQNLGFEWLPKWHFAVAVGYDLEHKKIRLRSARSRLYEADLGLFIKTWQGANQWAMVIMPADKMPATATPKPYLKAASELEQVGHTFAAQQAYNSALLKWDNNNTALIGLGNTHFVQGNFQLASQYFSRFITQKSDSAIGWNNLAFSLEKYACFNAARQAVECAVELAPQKPFYATSMEEILQLTATKDKQPDHKNCPKINCPIIVL